MPYPGPQSEVSQRVMAVLYIQKDGAVLSEAGSAISRMRSLMAGDYAHNTVSNAIRGLENANLIVRDNRYHSGTTGRLVEVRPGQSIKAGMRCFGVHLAVERDQLPLKQEYVDELRLKISGILAGKAHRPPPPPPPRRVRDSKAEDRSVQSTPLASKPEVATEASSQPSDQDLPAGFPDEVNLIARSLLEQVLQLAHQEPQPALVEELRTAQDAVREALARLEDEHGLRIKAECAAEAARKRRDEIADMLAARDRTLETMRERINTLGEENERLKRAALQRVGGDTRRLTQEIADIVSPEAREALKRLGTERPGGAPAHRSPHGQPGSRPL